MKIAFLGDIALFGKYTINNTDLKYYFDEIKKILSSCDYVVGNLETPLTNRKKTIGGKSAYIKGCPEDVQILKNLGVTHVSLANNHMFDFREEGLLDTIHALNEADIKWYGAFGKTEEIVFDGVNIRFRGYCCYSTNGKGLSGDNKGIDELNGFKMEKDLLTDKEEGFLTVASCHWGQEHVHYPNYDHVQLVRRLAKLNTTFFHGHHPHVIQGIEKIEDSLIAYSLGNFCFDDVYTSKSKEPLVRLSRDNKESYILIIDFEDNVIVNYEVVTFSFEKDRLVIELSIQNKIDKWSDFLKTAIDEYNSIRNDRINSFINERKKMRNVQWYLKRINMNSLLMMIGARYNKKQYNKKLKTYSMK